MRRRLPPLNSLRAFEVVARHANFRDAARELHVTPAAVSQQIKTLEDHLGRKLLRRHSGGYGLTADARVGLDDLRAGFDLLASATQKFRHAEQRTLRISTEPSLAVAWLVARLARFKEQHPALDVLLHASEELVDFGHAGFDMGIRYGTGKYPGLASQRLFVEEIFPVCSPQVSRITDSDGSLDLKRIRLLHTDWDPPVGKWPGWEEWLAAAGISGINARKGPHFSDGTLALQAAVSGEGIALTNHALALDHLAAGRLVQPYSVTLATEFAYYLVCAKTRVNEPDLLTFRRWLFAEAKRA
jgi:LysR family transcriptional regulator, glycine cleavage system transcriptional activator